MKNKFFFLLFFCVFFLKNTQAQAQVEKPIRLSVGVQYTPQLLYFDEFLFDNFFYAQTTLKVKKVRVNAYYELKYRSVGGDLGFRYKFFEPFLYAQKDFGADQETYFGGGINLYPLKEGWLMFVKNKLEPDFSISIEAGKGSLYGFYFSIGGNFFFNGYIL